MPGETEYEIKIAECTLCGETAEAVVFEPKWWLLTVTIVVCQGCVSRIFRRFQKGK